jgi:D-arabinose 1-dehydrogenase-like Zn-dependent alcohol dehydrogenase
MLQFAVDKGVRTWVDVRPMNADSINQALADAAENRVRYRVVLVPEGSQVNV